MPQPGAMAQLEHITPVHQLHHPPSPNPSFLQAGSQGQLAAPKGYKASAFPTPLLGFCRLVQTGGGRTGHTEPCP